jgi:putative tryptophan/tyrosine transport system substrate-binding protein
VSKAKVSAICSALDSRKVLGFSLAQGAFSGGYMQRREFITLVGGAAASVPFATRAQQSMPVIGFLRSTTAADATEFVTAFRQGLKDTGYVEGQNVAIEFRWAEGRTDRLPALVDELIHWPVALIVGDAVAMLAAKSATTSVPNRVRGRRRSGR